MKNVKRTIAVVAVVLAMWALIPTFACGAGRLMGRVVDADGDATTIQAHAGQLVVFTLKPGQQIELEPGAEATYVGQTFDGSQSQVYYVRGGDMRYSIYTRPIGLMAGQTGMPAPHHGTITVK